MWKYITDFISNFRLIEFPLIVIIVSSLVSTSNTPFGVAILQTTDNPQGSKIAAIIMTIVSTLGSFLMLLFRIFVYFSITRDSNNLIPFSTVLLLNFITSIPIVFKILDVAEEIFLSSFSMIIVVKYIFHSSIGHFKESKWPLAEITQRNSWICWICEQSFSKLCI